VAAVREAVGTDERSIVTGIDPDDTREAA